MNRMTRYAIKRLLFVPVGLFVVMALSFLIVSITPGDPALIIAGDEASPEIVAEIRADLGLDKDLFHRFIAYVAALLQGDLGTSYFSGQPIWQGILQRAGSTLELVALAMIVAVVFGLFIGVVRSYYRGRGRARVAQQVVSLTQAIPEFLTGLVLIFVFFNLLGWAPPPTGRLGILTSPPPTLTGGFITDALLAGQWTVAVDGLRHAILPALTLGIAASAFLAKSAHAALDEAFTSDQVSFARACGLSEWKVVSYALKQARGTVLTFGAIVLATLVGSTAIIEIIFSWGGLGQWMVESIFSMDLPVIQAFVLLTGVSTFLVYFALDLVRVWLDPRLGEDLRRG